MFLPWPWLIIVFIQQLWWRSAFQLYLCEYLILHDGQNNPLYLPLERVKFQNQLRETRLFLIIPHDDKTLCYSVSVCVCVCSDLLLPMKDPNNNKDEDTHADQCDGRQQHAVAGSKVQFSAPTKKREREGESETKKDCHMLFYVLP